MADPLQRRAALDDLMEAEDEDLDYPGRAMLDAALDEVLAMRPRGSRGRRRRGR